MMTDEQRAGVTFPARRTVRYLGEDCIEPTGRWYVSEDLRPLINYYEYVSMIEIRFRLARVKTFIADIIRLYPDKHKDCLEVLDEIQLLLEGTKS